MKIAAGVVVVLSYELRGEGGEVLESSAEEGELRYRHGHGEIFPAIEHALEGRSKGERIQVELAPEEGFGAYEPEGVVTVPRKEIPAEVDLHPEDFLPITIEADTGETIELEARVVSLDEREVVLDTNHPLAGQRVVFHFRIVSVEAAPVTP